MNNTFNEILNSDKVLYRYIAGSTLYHTNEENGESDVDTKGLFIADINELYGIGFDKSFRDKYPNLPLYQTQINDEKNDNVLYEIGKYMGLLLSSNANVLESLFVPDDMMIVRPHVCLMPLFENRDKFITKDCFKPFISYAIEQIRKARGLNKKIVNPITERKGILDFCYTTYGQGSSNIQNWLEYRGMNQKYCGLVNIPNMHDVYGVYYDWGNHFLHENITDKDIEGTLRLIVDGFKLKASDVVTKIKDATDKDEIGCLNKQLKLCYFINMLKFIHDFYRFENWSIGVFRKFFYEQKPIGYSGMVGEKSQQLRLCSVAKNEKPICHISYNKDGYIKHCIDYRNYKEWEKFRNPKRYESNLDKNYDSKNLYHSIRLMNMGYEIATGQGVILDRRIAGDRDFIMDVRHHKFEYDELMAIILEKEKKLKEAIEKSTLPEHIDVNLVNDILIEIRKKYYGKN